MAPKSKNRASSWPGKAGNMLPKAEPEIEVESDAGSHRSQDVEEEVESLAESRASDANSPVPSESGAEPTDPQGGDEGEGQ